MMADHFSMTADGYPRQVYMQLNPMQGMFASLWSRYGLSGGKKTLKGTASHSLADEAYQPWFQPLQPIKKRFFKMLGCISKLSELISSMTFLATTGCLLPSNIHLLVVGNKLVLYNIVIYYFCLFIYY